MQDKKKYVYVVLTSQVKANDYALSLEFYRELHHFDKRTIKVIKLCLE